jgi:hypothetical protein
VLVASILRDEVVLSSVLDGLVGLIVGLNVFLHAKGHLFSLNCSKLIESKSKEQALGQCSTDNRRGSFEGVEFKDDHVRSQLVIQFDLRIDSLTQEPCLF